MDRNKVTESQIASWAGEPLDAHGITVFYSLRGGKLVGYQIHGRTSDRQHTTLVIVAEGGAEERFDQHNGMSRAIGYHTLWGAGARYFEVWSYSRQTPHLSELRWRRERGGVLHKPNPIN